MFPNLEHTLLLDNALSRSRKWCSGSQSFWPSDSAALVVCYFSL